MKLLNISPCVATAIFLSMAVHAGEQPRRVARASAVASGFSLAGPNRVRPLTGQPSLTKPTGREPFVYRVAAGSSRVNRLTLRRAGRDLTLIEDKSGRVLRRRTMDAVSSVVVQGAPGANDDTLTINFSGGRIAPPLGIHYDGGRKGFDTLVLMGGHTAQNRHVASNAHDGTIALDDTSIFYKNIEPINDTVATTSFTFNATGAGETINIVDGPLVSGFQTTQINSGASNTFELINFANKTNVTVNGGSGNDTMLVNVSNPAAGLSSLAVSGGGTGGDTLSIPKFSTSSADLTGIGVNTVTQTGPITGGAIVFTAAGAVQLAAINAASLRVTTSGALNFTQAVSTPAGFVGMTAGSITQGGAAPISTINLLVLGTGPAVLTNPQNSAGSIAANVSGGFSYTNAGNLTVLSVTIIGYGSAPGLNTVNAPISINTVDGTLSLNQAANAGSSTISLTAGSAVGQDRQLQFNSSATAGGGVTASADNISLANSSAAINAGATAAVVKPFQSGTLIDLGGADAANTLGLDDAELDKVSAGTLTLGSPTSGNASVTATLTPGASNHLELITGGAIQDAFNGTDITVASLGMTAATGIGSPGTFSFLDTTVQNLEAQTDNGNLLVSNAGAVKIGGVNLQLHGLSVLTTGNMQLAASGTISLADTDGLEAVHGGSASGTVIVQALGATSDVVRTVDGDALTAPGGFISVSAGRDILLGTAGLDFDNDVRASGSLTLQASRNVTVDGFTDVASDDFGLATGGGVTVTAGGAIAISNLQGDDASLGANGSAGADVSLNVGANQTFNLSVPLAGALFSSSGDVTINADRAAISGSSGIAAINGSVRFQQVSAAWNINLGSAADATASTLELSDAELDRVSTPLLQIGVPTNIGNISTTAAITSGTYDTLELRTAGLTAGPNGFSVSNLILTNGSATGRSYIVDGSVSPNTIQVAAAATFHYVATTLTVNGGSGNDTFNVKASPTTAISIDGNNPTTAPGDSLTYNALGRAVAGDVTAPDGSITSPTVQPVNFQEIETLNFSNFVPSLFVDDVNVVEGNSGTTDAIFTLSLNLPSSSTVSVNFFTAAATATSGADYTATAGSRTFTPGITSQTVAVPVKGDAAGEDNETFFLNLNTPTNAAIADAQGLGTIFDDDTQVQFVASAFSVSENAGHLTVNVLRTGDTTRTSTVNFATTAGTAGKGSDYNDVTGLLTFNPGVVTQAFNVTLVNNVTVEPMETFTVALGTPTGAILKPPSTATVTILDEDGNFTINGRVANHSGTGIPNVQITRTGSPNVVTNASGNYSFTGVKQGNYTIAPLITPALNGVTFFPSSTNVTVNTSNLNNINFTASFTVTGKVSNSNGVGIPNIQVRRTTPSTSVTVVTNASGNYTFTGVRSDSYTIAPVVTASLTGTSFFPASTNVTVNTNNLTNINFTAFFSISGRVIASGGAGIANVLVTLSTPTSSTSVLTGAGGNYTFGGVRSGSYTLTPTKGGLTFSPVSRSVTVGTANLTNVNFTGS